jgi:hypothetical protein
MNANIKGNGKIAVVEESDIGVNSAGQLDLQNDNNNVKIDTILQNPSKAISPRPEDDQALNAPVLA